MRSIIIFSTALSAFLIALAPMAMAQSAPPATPIDGGLSWLLLAGGAYGVKKLKDRLRN